jgi:hypothetical protein
VTGTNGGGIYTLPFTVHRSPFTVNPSPPRGRVAATRCSGAKAAGPTWAGTISCKLYNRRLDGEWACTGPAEGKSLEADDPEAYARALEGAREDVLVIAARRGLPPAAITVRFDPGRDPGPHTEHVLSLSTVDDSVVVEERGIPHQWIVTMGTGYIDQRFVRRVTALLFRLERKAAELGIRL